MEKIEEIKRNLEKIGERNLKKKDRRKLEKKICGVFPQLKKKVIKTKEE